VHLLGAASLGSKLLLRACYTKLLEVASNLKQEYGGMRKIVLTGHPGIGNSLWVAHLLHTAADLNMTFVLQLGKQNDARFLFRQGHAILKGSRSAFEEYLEDSAGWYIVDSQNSPVDCLAWTVFVNPIIRANFWRFFKENPDADRLYMPA
jgi:hypothetical protein